MKSSIAVIVFFTFTVAAYASTEIYEQEGVGYASTHNKACDEALLYAKKYALDSAGAIMHASVQSNTEQANNAVNKISSVDLQQMSNGLVKVIDKTIDSLIDKDGSHICHVKAKLSVDTSSILVHNKKYDGQLPDWAITQPRILGKHTIVAHAKSLDGALSVAIFTYAEMNLHRGKQNSCAGFIDQFQKTEDRSAHCISKRITNEAINAEVNVTGMSKFYVDRNSADYSEVIKLNYGSKIAERKIKYYREQPQEGIDQEMTEIVADTASIDAMITSLKQTGFTIEFEKITSADLTEWYVLLIGKKISNTTKN